MKWISSLLLGLLIYPPLMVLLFVQSTAKAQDQLKLPGEVSTWFVNTDGSCVQCSISNCGVWQNCPQASTLLFDSEYGSRQHGGSGPGRVEAYSDKRQIPCYNVTGNTFEDIRPWMIWASRTGRIAAIGCFSSHFQTELYHSDTPNDPKPWKVRNNWRGITDTYYQWTEDEFKKYCLQSGPWLVVLKTPAPPPSGATYIEWWKGLR